MPTGRDFFTMTKRERRGTIAVLCIIAVLLVLSFTFKRSKTSVPDDVKVSEMQLFEAEVDSIQVTDEKPKTKARPVSVKGKSRKKRQQPQRKEKPKQRPRNVDPLPQF